MQDAGWETVLGGVWCVSHERVRYVVVVPVVRIIILYCVTLLLVERRYGTSSTIKSIYLSIYLSIYIITNNYVL
jgi:hypothetical protein